MNIEETFFDRKANSRSNNLGRKAINYVVNGQNGDCFSVSGILIIVDDYDLSSGENRYGESRGKDGDTTKGKERRNAVCKLTDMVATERRKARVMAKRFGGDSIDDLKQQLF